MIADFYDDIQEHVGDPPNGVTFSFSTQISAKDVFVSTKEVRRELLIGIEKTNSETFAIRETVMSLVFEDIASITFAGITSASTENAPAS